MNQELVHTEAVAALARLEKRHPELKQELEKAWGFAIFPSVGRASAVLGGAYGHGEVFEQGKSIGFATLSQISIGVQLGGQTFSELILFEDEDALERLKEGKIGFAANASAVIVKGGAAATNNYKQGLQIYVHTEGGLAAEAAIGGQKLIYKPAALTRRKTTDEDTAEKRGHTQPAVDSHPPS